MQTSTLTSAAYIYICSDGGPVCYASDSKMTSCPQTGQRSAADQALMFKCDACARQNVQVTTMLSRIDETNKAPKPSEPELLTLRTNVAKQQQKVEQLWMPEASFSGSEVTLHNFCLQSVQIWHDALPGHPVFCWLSPVQKLHNSWLSICATFLRVLPMLSFKGSRGGEYSSKTRQGSQKGDWQAHQDARRPRPHGSQVCSTDDIGTCIA